MPEPGLQRPGAQLLQTGRRDLPGIVQFEGVEDEGGDQGALFGRFEEGVEVFAAGPAVLFKLGENTVEQRPGDVARINPVMGDGAREGGAKLLVIERKGEKVVLGGVSGEGTG